MSNISLTTLGGVRENGKNMYIAEIDGSIFVLDAGLKYPENEQLGVDVVIPNMDYLFENSDRIAGVFLTHGHADAIGALPYLLAEAKVPVFGSELTIELAKLFVKGNDAVKKFNDFHVIDEDSEIDFGGTVVSFFRTTHSIPESLDEAAEIDGANKFTTYFRIIFPMMKPMHATTMIINALWFWNDFMLPLLILNKDSKMWTLPLFQYNYQGQYFNDYGPSFASYIVGIVTITVVYLIFQKHIISGMSNGAVK